MKRFWVGGIFFAITFTVLFSTRIGLLNLSGLSRQVNESILNSPVKSVDYRNTWMNIFQNGKKIGYTHSTFSKENAGYLLKEDVFMRLNTMGFVQDINLKIKADLNQNLTLSSFDFNVNSGSFSFSAKGNLSNDVLMVETKSDDNRRNFNIKLKNKPYLMNNVIDTIRTEYLTPGQTLKYSVFDPATLGEQAVTVNVIGKEKIKIMGEFKNSTKVSLSLSESTQYAWIGEDGDVLKESGLLGITFEKTNQFDALVASPMNSSEDITLLSSIPSNILIENPNKLEKLFVTIEGIKKYERLQSGRQALKGHLVTITKESIPNNASFTVPKDIYDKYLEANAFIQSDHPKIKNLVQTIVNNTDSPIDKARKILAWMYKNIEKKPVLSIPDALSTLENKVGDCNEHSILFAALLRASGIPSQIEVGLVYLNGRFYYHAWNSLYLGDWITADSVFNQIPADVTHIRFASGDSQSDLADIIGKIKLIVSLK
ncbi:MAG: lasso peptide biosynthesis protein [Desulfobacterales bacterium]|nr:lasso peptide biosynthesis protein [Desulfobacterales bacterium]